MIVCEAWHFSTSYNSHPHAPPVFMISSKFILLFAKISFKTALSNELFTFFCRKWLLHLNRNKPSIGHVATTTTTATSTTTTRSRR